MQPSPISLLIKRDFVIFERVPMVKPGFGGSYSSPAGKTPCSGDSRTAEPTF